MFTFRQQIYWIKAESTLHTWSIIKIVKQTRQITSNPLSESFFVGLAWCCWFTLLTHYNLLYYDFIFSSLELFEFVSSTTENWRKGNFITHENQCGTTTLSWRRIYRFSLPGPLETELWREFVKRILKHHAVNAQRMWRRRKKIRRECFAFRTMSEIEKKNYINERWWRRGGGVHRKEKPKQ